MNNNTQRHMRSNNQQGVVIVVIALCLVLLLAIAALAVDVGYLYSARNELQNVADSAALAGARYLGETYSGMTDAEIAEYFFSQENVVNKINETAEQNRAGNETISILSSDVKIGKWDPITKGDDDDLYEETLNRPDAVAVIARRDGSVVAGPMITFFARLFNINDINLTSRKAIAALTGPSYVEEGELKTPFGLSMNNFPDKCKDIVEFSPTTESCAGWHNFFDPINGNLLEAKLLGLISGDVGQYGDLWNGRQWLETNFGITPDGAQTPATFAGEAFNFQGGDITKVLGGPYLDSDYDTADYEGDHPGNGGSVTGTGNPKNPASMRALFDYYRYRDEDGDDSQWTTTVPVYKDETQCINPNGKDPIPIVGYAEITILAVEVQPNSEIRVYLPCQLKIIDSRGGGATYGNFRGKIPNLVK